MIDNEEFAQLSKYFCKVCVALEATIQGNNVDDLGESVVMALEDLEMYADWPWPSSPSADHIKQLQALNRNHVYP